MPALTTRRLHTVFLDRDGTINVKAAAGQYITSPEEVVLLPGAATAIAMLNAAGLRVILITNQRWLSNSSEQTGRYRAIHARLEQLLAREGAWLDGAYHCPHAADLCECRKPGAGMLRRAAREHGFNLAGTVVVGDSNTDVQAGRAVGTATILIRAGGRAPADADAVANNLDAAARLILQANADTEGRAGTAF
jgi:D-glycero-D-manno-heptose 1,7-bisphosphate phosphatase